MKVVFAIDEAGSSGELGAWLRIAIDSVVRNTSLTPIVLADRPNADLLSSLEQIHVACFEAQSPLSSRIDDLNVTHGYPLQAKGNYLRYESYRFIDDEYFLYADCDTIFLGDPQERLTPTRTMSLAPADNPYNNSEFNSGIIFFNTEFLRNSIDGFYDFASRNLIDFLPGFDQLALNEYFRGQITPMSPELNWRPSWGFNEDSTVLHFHGVKLELIDGMLSGHQYFSGPKSDQVLKIIAETLTQLPATLTLLDEDFLRSHQLLLELRRFSVETSKMLANPVARSMVLSGRIRDKAEKQSREILLSITEDLLHSAGSIEPVTFAISGKNHKFIRILLKTNCPVICMASSILINEESTIEQKPSYSNNVYLSNQVNSLKGNYQVFNRVNRESGLDFVFEVRDSYKIFSISIFSLGNIDAEVYWHDGEGFSSTNCISATFNAVSNGSKIYNIVI